MKKNPEFSVFCFFYPHIILTNVSLFQASYPVEAKKNLANFTVVLDTPEYKRVTELKTHMSNVSCSSKHIWSYCLFF